MARIYKPVGPSDNKAVGPGKEAKETKPSKGGGKDEKKEGGGE